MLQDYFFLLAKILFLFLTCKQIFANLHQYKLNVHQPVL